MKYEAVMPLRRGEHSAGEPPGVAGKGQTRFADQNPLLPEACLYRIVVRPPQAVGCNGTATHQFDCRRQFEIIADMSDLRRDHDPWDLDYPAVCGNHVLARHNPSPCRCDRGASRSEENTSELPSLMSISYAGLCL